MSKEGCQNMSACKAIKDYYLGIPSINTLEDILRIIELIAQNDCHASDAMSCRYINNGDCFLSPNNKLITDARIKRALEKI